MNTHKVTHLYLLANIFRLCNKAEAEAFGFPRQKVHTFLTWRHHTPLVVLLQMHTYTWLVLKKKKKNLYYCIKSKVMKFLIV